MKLKDRWNKNKFSVYESEEKTVLRLIQNIYNWLGNFADDIDNKTDIYGDHKGTWQGLEKPTLSDEGMRATVEKLVKDIEKIENNITLNIKDFGAKGDNSTDDTQAFKDAFAFIKTLQTDFQFSTAITLKIPKGIYLISEGLKVDVSVAIVGECNVKPVSYKNFGANAYQQDMSPNISTIKFIRPLNNITMITPQFSSEETEGKRFRKDFYIKDIMLDGNDGVVKQQDSNVTPTGVKDITIEFTTTNCNGIDMSNVNYMKGSENVNITGFSGYGLKTYHWQQHHNVNINLCGVGIITGGDGSIVNSNVAFCKNGVQVGADGLVGATDRINNIRVEWCEEYGIVIKNGGNNRISGYIDRCGYSGYCQPSDTWGMNIDLTVQRSGAVWRGGNISNLSTKELKQQGSNVYINNGRSGNFRITNLKSGSDDSGHAPSSPVIATSIIGTNDYVLIESTQGYDGNFHNMYYTEGNSNGTIISNGMIHCDNGIKIDKDTNKTYIDIFNAFRFRPPINWGKPSDSVGYPGDLMFDSESNIMYYKNATNWKAL